MSENNLTHFDAAGNAVMVDVSGKPVTAREATARGILTMNVEAFAAVQSGTVKKGDVLGVARIAGNSIILNRVIKFSLIIDKYPILVKFIANIISLFKNDESI